MAAPTAGALTTAGYVQVGTTGVYNKTFGSVVVSFSIPQSSGSFVSVTPTGDVSAADLASVQASFAVLGIPQPGQVVPGASGVITPFAPPVMPPVNWLAVNGTTYWGMSF